MELLWRQLALLGNLQWCTRCYHYIIVIIVIVGGNDEVVAVSLLNGRDDTVRVNLISSDLIRYLCPTISLTIISIRV